MHGLADAGCARGGAITGARIATPYYSFVMMMHPTRKRVSGEAPSRRYAC